MSSIPPEVGDRVGLIADIEDHPLRLLGYGIYEGDFVPSGKAVGELADEMRLNEQPCPRFKLDSGEVVWGCEAQWGHESVIQDLLAKRREYNVISLATLRTDLQVGRG